MSHQMQAQSVTGVVGESVIEGDGQLYTWVVDSPDFSGAGFPGPGVAFDVVLASSTTSSDGGGGGGGGGTGVSVHVINQNDNIPLANLVDSPTPGIYRITSYIGMDVAGTSGNLTVNVTFVDDTCASRTVPVAVIPNISVLDFNGGVVIIQTEEGNVIQWSVDGVDVAGALDYSVRVTASPEPNG